LTCTVDTAEICRSYLRFDQIQDGSRPPSRKMTAVSRGSQRQNGFLVFLLHSLHYWKLRHCLWSINCWRSQRICLQCACVWCGIQGAGGDATSLSNTINAELRFEIKEVSDTEQTVYC